MIVKNQQQKIDSIIKIVSEGDADDGLKYIKDNFVFDNDEQTYLPDLYRQIAAKLQINKDYKNSIVFYEKYLDFDLNNEEILIEKGICLISIEEFEKSLEIFIKIYDNNKSNIKVVLGLGSSLFYLGKFDKARPYIEEAIKLAPDYHAIREIAGNIYHHLGIKDKAINNMAIAEGIIEFTDNNKNFKIYNNIK